MENSINEDMTCGPIEQSSIEVLLRKNAVGDDVLHFEGSPEELDINFAKSDQTSLRKLFCWLLDEQLKQKKNLTLAIDPSVKNVTYKKVAEDYVSDLNVEIDSIFASKASVVDDLTSEISFGLTVGGELV